jgi:adenylate kinase family enzyme
MKYKRIMIFGLPGSGKSTFALTLNQALKLPLYHLDKYFYVENWVERDKEDFLNIQNTLVEKETWIIDGNAIRSLQMRYVRADLVLYFWAPRLVCLSRLIQRRFFKDKSIKDRANGCRERLPFHLIRYMWTFDHRVRPILDLLQKTYPHTPFYAIRSLKELRNIPNLMP